MWNYEIIFNYFNPDYTKRVPRLKDAYEDLQHLLTSVPDDKLPMAIGEGVDVFNPFNRLRVESFFNEANKMHSNINEIESNSIFLLNLFLVIMSVYNIYRLYIKNMRDIHKNSNTIHFNKIANQLLNNKQKEVVQGTEALEKKGNTVNTSNANQLTEKRVLDNLFELYIDNDFVDIETFENLAVKVDEKLEVFLKNKYQYILQPNDNVAIIKLDIPVIKDTEHKTKLENMSKLLHAMHNAQRTYLLSIHDPHRLGTDDADLLHGDVLRTFKETYKEITSKEIIYKVDETTGEIRYSITSQGQQLTTLRGGKKKTNTKPKDSKEKSSKKSTVKCE